MLPVKSICSHAPGGDEVMQALQYSRSQEFTALANDA